MNRPIFVFGSNEAGKHGKGAALDALRYHGAIYGEGFGLQGSSYAIPTKDARFRVLPIPRIAEYVYTFGSFAERHPHLRFHVTAIGCGLAGYTPEQMAPLFTGAPDNCYMPTRFLPYLEPGRKTWGDK